MSASTGALRIRELPRGAPLGEFIDLAWRMNQHLPKWVPPLRVTLESLLDREKHPFHQHADAAYFLVERGGVPVGRITAHINHLHNEFHEERTGFWGFFECENEPATAAALFSAAEVWLRERGMSVARGPMNFSTNEECGLLVDGFDVRPSLMMPYNPPYYGELIEAVGHAKATDLLAYRVAVKTPPQRLVRACERVLARENATIRPLDMKRYRQEIDLVKEVYNSAWSRNWGFVPMTDAEFEHLAGEMRPIVDPNICLIVEIGGEPVGFSLSLPDLNQALRHLPNGRLLPTGIFKLLWYKRKIDAIRVLTLGFKPEYQQHGFGAALYLRTWQIGVERGYYSAEASWILEDNQGMRGPLEKLGFRVEKRYRIYEKDL